MGIPRNVTPESSSGWHCKRSYLYGSSATLDERSDGLVDISVSYNCRRDLPGGGEREVSYIVSFPVDSSTFPDYAKRALTSLLSIDRGVQD